MRATRSAGASRALSALKADCVLSASANNRSIRVETGGLARVVTKRHSAAGDADIERAGVVSHAVDLAHAAISGARSDQLERLRHIRVAAPNQAESGGPGERAQKLRVARIRYLRRELDDESQMTRLDGLRLRRGRLARREHAAHGDRDQSERRAHGSGG